MSALEGRLMMRALREARRRWGKTARVEQCDEPAEGRPIYHEKTGREIYRAHRCVVGRIALGLFFEVKGQGPTWEAAFAEVDRLESEVIAKNVLADLVADAPCECAS